VHFPHSSIASILLLFLTVPIVPAQARQIQGAQRLWAANCQSCHGENGQGGGAGTRTLLTDDLFDQQHDKRFFDAIKNGLPEHGMDAFGQTNSEADCWALVVHLRELQAKERRTRLGSPKPAAGVFTSQRHKFKIETVIDTKQGLQTPWSVDFLPDGRMLVADRPGTLRIFDNQKLGSPILSMPRVRNRGQGGLMDVAPHPRFTDNGWIYLSFSDELEKGSRNLGFTKVVRGRIKDGTWTDQETIYQAKPEHYSGGDVHFGCRLVFQGPPVESKYLLYFCIGERGRMETSPDLARPNGKVHRVWDDGQVPSDNPFVQTESALPTIWSYGHRNHQGLAFDLEGRLWDTEHGPRGGDEINLVEKRRNYGWPEVCFGINYNDAPFSTPWPDQGKDIAMPVFRWLPSIGACGLDVARGPAFPEWKGDLLAGGLAGQNLDRIRVTTGDRPTLIEREELIHRMGRVRDVVCAPDGTIYVVLNDPDKVIRLVPAHEADE